MLSCATDGIDVEMEFKTGHHFRADAAVLLLPNDAQPVRGSNSV
jgi:hypothetical protein